MIQIDQEALAGDHDDTVSGDLALDAHQSAGQRWQWRIGYPAAAQPGPVVGGDRRWQALVRTSPAMTWIRCPSSRSVTLLRASSGRL